jgi:UDP-N-acetylmuramoyl-tripeptide--D-alanyl-D-alanine ligase
VTGTAAVGCLFTLEEAALAMGGTLVGNSGPVGSVVADSRDVLHGSLFFALPGKKVDGHSFVAEAFKMGAVAVVVEKGSAIGGDSFIQVIDTKLALMRLATWYRAKMPAKVIGVTGSTGKTSVKEMIAAALAPMVSVHKTEGNLNTEVGVPLAMLHLCAAHMISVVEMAMRGPGQIAELCDIAKPSIGVVTNIGLSHVGELGSPEAIADAKAELLSALPSDGAAILPKDSPYFESLRSKTQCPIVTFGTGGDVHVMGIEATDTGSDVTFSAFGRRVQGHLNAIGLFQAANACAALAVASALGLDVARAAEALQNTEFPPHRMQLIPFGGVRVLADMYNASPDSMTEALKTLAQMEAERKIAVLGGMLEMGDYKESEHRAIGRLVAELGIDVLAVVGKEAGWIADAAAEASIAKEGAARFESTEAVAEWLPKFSREGDLILIKGSRSLHMERLLDALGAGAGA